MHDEGKAMVDHPGQRVTPRDAVRILIVDDESSVRGFIARVLTRNGFDCRTAADASEAVSVVQESSPTLAICDLRMPGKDGKWLLRELKSRWPETSVIMLSAVADAKTAVECLKSGAEDYLVKPIDLDELLIAVRRTTDRIRLIRESRESREHLEEARHRTAQLQQAFQIIEDTYQDALGALLKGSPVSAEPSAAEPKIARFDEAGPRTNELETPDTLQEVELAALRVAGELIGERASSLDVASAIGRELVDRGPLLYARLWRFHSRGDGLEAVVDIGGSARPGVELARRAVTTGKSQCEETAAMTTVTSPIAFGGGAEGALQLAWPARRSANMVAFTERLALVLAASLARELESKDRERTAEELDLFYKLAAASRHSLDLEHVAEFLFGSLHRIVDYDAAGLLILEDEPYLGVRTRFTADDAFTRRIRDQVLNTLRITCGVQLSEELKIHVEELGQPGGRSTPPDKLRSFVNVPFSVGGRVVGLIHVSSARDRAFTQAEIAFLNRAANFLASSVQGVRDLLNAVKGRVEQMVEHMTDGVLMLDLRGNVVAMNGAVRQILPPDTGDDSSWNASSLAELLEFDPLELLAEQPYGAKKLVCLRGVAYQAQLSAVTEDDGEVIGAVLAFRNFDEEKRADEMKSELVNVVSHELRTPLTAIRNALFLLTRPNLGELSEKHHHFLDLAQRNVEQLIETVNDLLDLSKIEAGKMHIQLQPTSIEEPLRTAVTSLAPQAEEEGVVLETTVAPDLPDIHGNGGALQRVVMNLVGNAIKYTEPGGRVRVEASLSVDDRDETARPAIRVSVSDSGVGIPRDQLETIFDKFQQAHRPDGRSQNVIGTGLGLSICRELIKAHHGRIWAESDEGSGSRFSFIVPLLSEAELFFRILATELDRAGEQHAPLVLVLAQVLDGEALETRLGSHELASLLEELLGSAQSIIRRSGDQALLRRDENQVAVLLPRTAVEGGRVFETRLLEAVSKSDISRKGLEIALGYSVYPDDGHSPEDLYHAAENRLRAGVTA